MNIRNSIQAITYIPHFLSTVVVVDIILNLLSHDGLINQLIVYLEVKI